MSIPRKHHYLPVSYLERWARDGQVFRYVRPRGVGDRLDCRKKYPTAIGYKPDLYRLPDVDDSKDSQVLELKLFQKIDDRAAIALRKLDQSERGTAEDRIALSQFMISLLHRSPSRLMAMKAELAERTDGAPYEDLTGENFDQVLTATTNRLLAMLVESPEATSMISRFRAFKIQVSKASKSLLTSDRPVMLSAQLIAPDAFMMLPYAPDRLVILTHHEAIASSFASQDHNKLVNGINQAVVEQSEDMIIASDDRATRMIDRLFLTANSSSNLDPIGLIRRRSPLVDLHPKTRAFSRHDKAKMKYLGT